MKQFKLLAFIQEEVHRFAIKFHRERRSKNKLHRNLIILKDRRKTKYKLIRHFKSVNELKRLNFRTLKKQSELTEHQLFITISTQT